MKRARHRDLGTLRPRRRGNRRSRRGLVRANSSLFPHGGENARAASIESPRRFLRPLLVVKVAGARPRRFGRGREFASNYARRHALRLRDDLRVIENPHGQSRAAPECCAVRLWRARGRRFRRSVVSWYGRLKKYSQSTCTSADCLTAPRCHVCCKRRPRSCS
jgi:hypothetical protein